MTENRDPMPTSDDGLVTKGHPMLVYTTLRLLLFAVPFGLLLALGAELVWAILIAALASSIVSIFALSRYRDRLSVSLSERKERTRAKMAERERSEDAWDDEMRTQPDDPAPQESDGGNDN